MKLPLYDAAVLVLASGRIAYSLTSDDIFEPARRLIWKHSPPEHGDVIVYGERVPARRVTYWRNNEEERARGLGRWSVDILPADLAGRDPGWIGRLVSCPDCMSFWVALAALVAYMNYPAETIAVLTLFAAWSLANLVARRF